MNGNIMAHTTTELNSMPNTHQQQQQQYRRRKRRPSTSNNDTSSNLQRHFFLTKRSSKSAALLILACSAAALLYDDDIHIDNVMLHYNDDDDDDNGPSNNKPMIGINNNNNNRRQLLRSAPYYYDYYAQDEWQHYDAGQGGRALAADTEESSSGITVGQSTSLLSLNKHDQNDPYDYYASQEWHNQPPRENHDNTNAIIVADNDETSSHASSQQVDEEHSSLLDNLVAKLEEDVTKLEKATTATVAAQYDYQLQAEWQPAPAQLPELEEEHDIASPVVLVSTNNNNIPTYTLTDVMNESTKWDIDDSSTTFGIIIYDPQNDKFIGLLSSSINNFNSSNDEDKEDDNTNIKSQQLILWHTMENLITMLHTAFPKRFHNVRGGGNGNNDDEFVIAISVNDYPHLLLPHNYDAADDESLKKTKSMSKMEDQERGGSSSLALAPVLMFGSTFRRQSDDSNNDGDKENKKKDATTSSLSSEAYPSSSNIIPMPYGSHLDCFHQYAMSRTVCDTFSKYGNSIETESSSSSSSSSSSTGEWWEELIPQVYWRGTDDEYLPTLSYLSARQQQQQQQQQQQHQHYSRPLNIDHVEVLIYEDEYKDEVELTSEYEEVMKERRKMLRHHETNKVNGHHFLHERMLATYTKVLVEIYDKLLPRWKGCVLSAQAELEIKSSMREASMKSTTKKGNKEKKKGDDDDDEVILPWANIKFTRHSPSSSSSSNSRAVAAATDTVTNRRNHAKITQHQPIDNTASKYKYHLDLASKSGTALSDTLSKLALPGLLFHHVTPTQDYISNQFEAWEHYIPIKDDLSNLHEMYDYAESHPDKAKRIAEKSMELMKELSTEDGFGKLYEEEFVVPLRNVIEAYQPVEKHNKQDDNDNGASYMDTVAELVQKKGMIPVMECSISNAGDANSNVMEPATSCVAVL